MIPTEIGNLRKLTTLAMFNSGIRAIIPSELGSGLQNLTLLDLSGNGLKGPIPDVLLRLKKLRALYLNDNEFTGTISKGQWEFLGTMERVVLYHNQFSGTLPKDIGDILSNRTKVFDIEYNFFSGSIPVSLARVSNLEYLYLSANLFTGTIPENLFASRTLSLHGNNFTGSVPQSVCNAVTSSGDGTIVYDCDGSLVCDCDCTCAQETF